MAESLGRAIDYSGGVPAAAAVKAAGYLGAFRYLPKNGHSGVRVLTAAELADYTAHGLGVAAIYEAPSGSRAGQGKAAGIADAQWAQAQMHSLGLVRGVYYTVDYDANPEAVLPYFEGIAATNGTAKSWAYASARVLTRLYSEGLIARPLWQPRAWSAGVMATEISAYQQIGYVNVGGVQCDYSEIYTPDWGQHTYTESDDDMTPDEVTTIVRAELKRALGNDYANANPAKVTAAGPISSRTLVKVWDGDGDKRPGIGAVYGHVISANTSLRAFLNKLGGKA